MPGEDLSRYKNQLRNVLEYYGVDINTRKKPPVIRCLIPGHTDNNPSMIVYEDRLYCPVCAESWDIFDAAGQLESVTEFRDKLQAVKKALGEREPDKKKSRKVSTKKDPVSLPPEKAKQIYSAEAIEGINKLNKSKWGKLIRRWPYKDKAGNIIMVDARFENEAGKNTISFWFDGKNLRARKPPACIYNLDRVYKEPEKPILIVEGCKAAEAAGKIPGFIPVTWNGGGKRAKLIDWNALKDREIFIYPDDDQKKDPSGELKEWNKQEGIAVAFEIKDQLPQAVIIRPLIEARKIKADGADIVEALQVLSPEKMAEYIRTAERLIKPIPKPIPDNQHFKILGTSDESRAYFIGLNERLVSCQLTSITKTYLMNLAPVDFWADQYAEKGRIDWEQAIGAVILSASARDFDPLTIRGRGAWRESDGRICYHDGKNITGEHDPEKLYIRRTCRDIGIKEQPAGKEVTTEIAETVAQMSFESPADAIRLMAWAALAPFAGALPWRPAGLITGASGSGKTTVIDLFVRPVASPEIFSGGESSAPGVRQQIKHDAAAVVIEEAEADTRKKRDMREDLFSLMRQSTSDNAPAAAKGTQDQKGIKFALNSMFLFVSISPEVEHVADDNRIFRVNMIMPRGPWAPLRDRLKALITPQNCRQIRALTWGKLPEIIRLANDLVSVIQDEIGTDSRFSLAEGILLSAYSLIWLQLNLKPEDLPGMVKDFYRDQNIENPRDQTEELIDRLLDQQIHIEKPQRENISIREILIAIHTGKMENEEGDPDFFSGLTGSDKSYLRNAAGRYGVAVLKDGMIAIAKDHHEIMKITGLGRGYQRQLWRYENLRSRDKVVYMAGKARRCILINGIMPEEEKDQ